jgi:hypothetical protein
LSVIEVLIYCYSEGPQPLGVGEGGREAGGCSLPQVFYSWELRTSQTKDFRKGCFALLVLYQEQLV